MEMQRRRGRKGTERSRARRAGRRSGVTIGVAGTPQRNRPRLMRLAAHAALSATTCAALPFVVLAAVATPAGADAVTCDDGTTATGSVNNQDAAELTKDDPLVVRDGEQLRVAGTVTPNPATPITDPATTTSVKVGVIDGVLNVTGDEADGTGAEYADTTSVDDYFDVGVGLYRVEVSTEGKNWQCEFAFYMKLDGDSMSKPAGLVALAALLLGAAGVMFVKGRKPREPGWIDGGLDTADQIAREEAWQDAGREHPDALQFNERAQHGWLPPMALKPNERAMWTGKVRLRGSAGAGFAWGLLLGLGIGLLGWQSGRWTVNLGSVVLFPLLVAAVSSAFAWFGWGYRVRDVVVLPPGTAAEHGDDGARPDGQLSFDDAPGPYDDPLADSGNGELVEPSEPTEVTEAEGPESAAAPEPSTPPAD